MNKLLLNFSCIGLIAACAPAVNPEAKQALGNYTHFVDSIYAANETWKTTTDTDVVEVPFDPEDPTLTRVDTIVTPADKKEKSLLVTHYWGTIITEQYEPLKAAAEKHVEQMNEGMKKEYEAARLKYEAMQASE